MPIYVYIAAIITQRIHGFHEHSMQWKKDRQGSIDEHNKTLLDNHDAKQQPVQNRKNSLV